MNNPFAGVNPEDLPEYEYDDTTVVIDLPDSRMTRGEIAAEIGKEIDATLKALTKVHEQWVVGANHDPRQVLRNMAMITRRTIDIGAGCMGLFKHDVTEMAVKQQAARLDDELRGLL